MEFAYPTTVDEAVKLLGAPDSGAVAVGGGTGLAVEGRRGAKVLVDVTRCGLDGIATKDAVLEIGAATRISELRHPHLPEGDGSSVLLEEAAQGIATQPLRNAITLGGNLVHLCRWSDMPLALLALDATVHIAHTTRGRFDLTIAELTEQHPRQVLAQSSLVTGVSVPLAGSARGACYRRFRTTTTDYSLVTVAAVIDVEGDECAQAAIAVGALTPRPVRVKKAEALLDGRRLDADRIAEAAKVIGEQINVASNFRMDADVRRRILVPVARRAIETAAARATEGRSS